MRLAFIVQRYGEEVSGGAELHCRMVAERLARSPEVDQITVLTSCARDYETWKNHYPPGVEMLRSVRIERFAVPFKRLKRLQSALWRIMRIYPCVPLFEWVWLWAQGPVIPGLLRRLRQIGGDYDAFFFFTYLYFPTVRGLARVPGRRIFIPTAHDEPPIHLKLFRTVFARPEAIAFNSNVEEQLVRSIFPINDKITDVVGCGVNLPTRTQHVTQRSKPYVLYLGRVTPQKGVDSLVRNFLDFKERYGNRWLQSRSGRYQANELQLLIVGGGDIPDLPLSDDVVREGFVDEDRKVKLLIGCQALIMPSLYESLSLVMLEAWTLGLPVLVERDCAVTRKHIQHSKGGLCYHGPEEFCQQLEKLLADPELRRQQGRSGQRYVEENYSWDRIERKLLDLVRRVT